MSNALWDMGIAFRGHSRYMQALLQNLNVINQMADPKSRIILLGLHFVDTERCLNNICRVCNDNMVQKYIREVQRRVFYCTKTSIFLDSFQFTENQVASSNTHDGVHFNEKLTGIQLDFVLQSLCLTGENCSVFSKKRKCDLSIPKINREEVLKKREQLQERHNASINDLNCYNRRDDSLYWSDSFVVS